MKFIWTALLSSVLFLSEITNLYCQNPNDSLLEHNEYKVDVREKNANGNIDKMTDVIYFNGGNVYCTFSTNNGYQLASYTITTKTNGSITVIRFQAQSTNARADVMIWKGTVRDKEIKGKATTYRSGKKRAIYFFEGHLQ